mgnify:FL=1
MSYAILEKEIKTLPEVLQKNIEDYVISVIDSYKKSRRKISLKQLDLYSSDKSSSVLNGMDVQGDIFDLRKVREL